MALTKDQLFSDQRKYDAATKFHSDQLQELLQREQEKRESEVRRERDEKRVAEKEHQARLEDLQSKLERVLKEKERECKEEADARVRDVSGRFEADMDRLNDAFSKLENEAYKRSQTIKLMEIERHQCDLRIVELSEALKSEKAGSERAVELANREKESDI